jgi:prepilin-type N-terminal cleavage/methylation domain-containing protein
MILRRVKALRTAGGEGGFTLLEVVVAMMLLAIGLTGAATVVSSQLRGGLSAAATGGFGAINRSNAISTATMLAQEKIEQLKHDAQWRGTGATLPAVGTTPLTASTSCSGTVSGNTCTETQVINFDTYSRTTTVTTDASLPAASATSRTVTVEVVYKAAGEAGTTLGGKVSLATVIAQRP